MNTSETLYVLFVCASVTSLVFGLVYCLLKDLKFPDEEAMSTNKGTGRKRKTE